MSTSFISDQDFTTPAHIRVAPADNHGPANETKHPSKALLTVIFLAAVWLVISAVPFGYIGAGRYDVFWSDAVTGITIATVTTIRMVNTRSAAFGWITGGLAGWLLVAPLVLRYGWSTSTANDVIVGMLILVCAALGTGDDRD
ncbi:hypothetical protein [Dactylosporangium sp. NPDC048998]|uniref:SPW repeat domain-containing protein n=1 Tax=Dactylosporangium sp. NPDC048998 TaxID=3363976 RepID=UPI0037238496